MKHLLLGLLAVSLMTGCPEEDNTNNKQKTNNTKEDMVEDMTTDQGMDQGMDQSPDMEPDQTTNACDTSRSACVYPKKTYTVKTIDSVTITSKDTGRELPIVIRIPTDALGERPVLIWSHGGGYNDNGHKQSKTWGETFSEHGFVVIHIGHVMPTQMQFNESCKLANVPQEECLQGDPVTGDRPYLDSAVTRPYDVVAALDNLPMLKMRIKRQENVDINLDQIALAGWSAGSQAALVFAGAKRDISPSVKGYKLTDDRIKVSIALSPQGPGKSGYTEMSYDEVNKPVLVATGDNDAKDNDLLPETRIKSYNLLPSGNNHHYLLYSKLPKGTGEHGTYNLGSLEDNNEQLRHFSQALVSTALAFLDAHLLDIEEAKTWIASDNAAKLANGPVEWQRK